MKLLYTLPLLFWGVSTTPISAQSFDRDVVAASGGTAISSDLILDWTVGELATSTVSTSDLTFTEGFQQAYLIVEEESVVSDEFDIRVAPNPVRNQLSVYINSVIEDMLRLDLFDINGRAIESLKVDPTIRLVNIDMYNYPAGMYVLRITNLNENGLIKSYKITKVN